MEIYKKLGIIQQTLKAGKDLYNEYGGYKYRSCESILEAVKPLLESTHTALVITDSVEAVGNRIYVCATAKLTNIDNPDETVIVTAYAREEESKKGMDASQITGAASSYARKYALNGLFCIDDNKDSDATNTHGEETQNAGNRPTNSSEGGSPRGNYVPTCVGCGSKITDAEHDYSVKKYKKPLCRACQKKEINNA